eukprot:CAMPEP_0113625608 /NCGR_PEP_ID=MMETSP0017_2-20120614/13230_1 /TAXON_ID=2856 /ORGANISM="Cylindrotheca closterium" /LENGTH=272 /DNA_ID=CAMNT_0000535733 /DNA_START=48 /DNA_END=866 /DNA_ORIENTATION=- /assembly_acc=CAM_ASM_000147
MNTIREVEKINQQELERGIAGTPASWHSQYRNSPWVYVGNLDHQLTEGDVLCVMSQFGEIEDINLARDEDTGKSRGFAFVKYEDARSCILAVDNLVGIKLCDRSLRVDHMEKYRLPKKLLEQEEAKEAKNFGAGHAYQDTELANKYSMHQGQDLFSPDAANDDDDEKEEDRLLEEKKRRKEEKKQQKEQDKMERRRKREERRIQKEEERRKHRSSKFRRHDNSVDNSRDKEEERRKHRKRKHHRRESSEDDSESSSSGEDRKRRRKSHKRRH